MTYSADPGSPEGGQRWPFPGQPAGADSQPHGRLAAAWAQAEAWAKWTAAGSAATVAGSLAPLVSQTSGSQLTNLHIGRGVTCASVLVGLALIGVAVLAALRPDCRMGAAVAALVAAIAGLSFYFLITAVGIAGFQAADGLGLTGRVSWMPGPGMSICALGYAVVAVASIAGLQEPAPAAR